MSGQKSAMRIENGSAFNFQVGQVYSGTITGMSNGRINLMLEGGTELSLSAKGAIERPIGAKIDFFAKDSGSGGIMLQMLSEMNLPTGQLDPLQTKDLFKQSGFITEENVFETDSLWKEDENAQNTRLALARIQSRIAYAADNLTLSAVNELLASGISIQKLNLAMLNTVLGEVKLNPKAISDSEMDEIIDRAMNELGLDKEGLENKAEIIKTLSEVSLPVSENNIEFVEKSLNIYQKAGQLSDGAMAYLIHSDAKGSLADYYSAGFSKLAKNENADMELLYKQLDSILSAEHIEVTAENKKNAAFLYEYDLPITKGNIYKAAQLSAFSDEDAKQIVTEKAVEAIKEGLKPEDVIIADLKNKAALSVAYKEISDFLPNATGLEANYLAARKIAVNLFNIRNAQVPADFVSKDQSTSKSTLIQIQHKLTHQVVSLLISKGINIDFMPLNRAFAEISKAEHEIFSADLADAAAPASPGNLGKMGDVSSALGYLKSVSAGVYSSVTEGKIPFTIEAMATENRKNAAISEFEKHAASPTASFGDSFEKAAPSLAAILSDIGAKPTAENLRHAEILVKSGMDISYENLMKVKIIDTKVNKIQQTLSPRIAADMIKSGFDPLNSHVDTVLNYVNDYYAAHGDSPTDSIAEAIYQLDKTGQLRADERESLIAMYRLFNQLEKSNYAAIGLNLKAGRIPTLKSLLDMADSAGAGFDAAVAESGYTEQGSTATQQALSRISGAGRSTEDEFSALIVRSFADSINMDNLSAIMSDKTLLERPIDELLEMMEKGIAEKHEVSEAEAKAAYEDIKTIFSEKGEVFSFLESIGLPATIANIKSYVELSKPRYFSTTIADIAAETQADASEYLVAAADLDADKESQPEEALNQAADKLEEKVLDSGKATLLREVKLLQNAVKVQNALSKRTNNFKIPVSIAGEAAQLNIFMPKGYLPGGELNVAVNIDLPQGSVMAACVLEGAEVSVAFNAENFFGDLDETNKTLLNALAEFGLKGKLQNYTAAAEAPEIPELSEALTKDHKDLVFNLGKAIMKFADILYSKVS